MRYQETGGLHLDFHGATNTTIDYVVDEYGVEALPNNRVFLFLSLFAC